MCTGRFQKCPNPPTAPASGYLLKPPVLELCERSANGEIALLERQTRSCGKTGGVWQSRIIRLIRTILEAKIRQEGFERTVGHDYDEDALRRKFGSDTELDELEPAGGRVDSGRRSQHEPQREHVANPGALVSAVQFREPSNTESQVEETRQKDRENGFITTCRSCIYM